MEHPKDRRAIPLLFRTRQQARDYNNKHNGYIRQRVDLQTEPHGWKIPKIVKVQMQVEIIK